MSNKILTIANATMFAMIASDREDIRQSVESRQRGALPLGGQELTIGVSYPNKPNKNWSGGEHKNVPEKPVIGPPNPSILVFGHPTPV